jgi:biopolymer transport protein ExbD
VGFKLGDDDGGGMSEINVTPLIDIMLVMFIIFMIITPPALL